MNIRKRAMPSRVLLLSLTLMLAVSGAAGIGFQVEKARLDIANLFTASGWMGDGELGRKYVEFSAADSTTPHSAPSCIKVSYTPGSIGWAGIYWQNQPDNWGDKPGTNYSNRSISKVSFWAKGARGGEVVEFKSGGIENGNKKFRDSFVATTGRVTLTAEWRPYQIDLRGANLSSVIGGFAWVVSRDNNSTKTVSFFLDDIYFE